MSEISSIPDVSEIEIPIDAWTEPFWKATAEGELMMVRCGDCQRYRWPPGPFCPNCQSQRTEWTPAGPGRIYSFTIVRDPGGEGRPPRCEAPALVEFPQAGGVRLLAAIVEAPLAAICIGAPLSLAWSRARNGSIPIFKLAE